MNTQTQATTFRNIYVHEANGQQYFCYRTGLTVYEETFANYRYMTAGWNIAGYPQDILEGFPTWLNNDVFSEPQAFDLEADGVSLGWDWDYLGFEQEEETIQYAQTPVIHGIVTLKNRLKPICVKIHTLLDGSPVLTRWLEIINDGAMPINLSGLAPISGGVEIIEDWKEYMQGAPMREKIYSLGYMDCSTWGHEGYFSWHDLPNNTYSIGGKYLDHGRFRHPMFLLRNNLLGSMMIAQLGWPGGYRFDFTLNTDHPHAACLSMKIALDSQKPFLVLDPKEHFESPQVHIGMLQGDLDDAINAMHDHLRRTVFTLPPIQGKKGWIEGGMGPEHIMDLATSRHFTDTLAAVGAEVMITDAGWYCPTGTEPREWHSCSGDWYPDPNKYRNGIDELRNYIHEKGMLFGLWVGLEELGEKSKIAQQHPEWLVKPYTGKKTTTLLNMADPLVAAWAESELTRIIEEYKIDLFRLDYNVSLEELLYPIHRGHGPENSFMRYYQNVNAMYRRLHEKFPQIIFENCASGGGRTDVTFVSHFTHTWVSDWNVAPRSFAVLNGMTMALPPELVDRLVSGMNCHTRASLPFQARIAIMGRPTTNDYHSLGMQENPHQFAIVRHAFEIYNTHIRPYIDDSRIYHHTPEISSARGGGSGIVDQPQGTGILERASSDGKHSVIAVFNLAHSGPETMHTIYPKGIDASLSYRVTMDNTGECMILSGAMIKQQGLRISLPGPLTSELILLEATEN